MKTEDYNKQAKDFLEATNTTFKAKFKEHGLYFSDDKEKRDIWKITLKNDNHRFAFSFGQSISGQGTEPAPYDILSCLTGYDPESFEDFCANYGYDSDSRKAYKTYLAVVKEYENVCKLFTPEQIELLQEIQ